MKVTFSHFFASLPLNSPVIYLDSFFSTPSIRKLECLGEERELPQRQRVHGEWHDKGAFFVVTCDLPTSTIPPIVSELSRDVDILKKNFIAVTPGLEAPTGKITENCLKPFHP